MRIIRLQSSQINYGSIVFCCDTSVFHYIYHDAHFLNEHIIFTFFANAVLCSADCKCMRLMLVEAPHSHSAIFSNIYILGLRPPHVLLHVGRITDNSWKYLTNVLIINDACEHIYTYNCICLCCGDYYIRLYDLNMV